MKDELARSMKHAKIRTMKRTHAQRVATLALSAVMLGTPLSLLSQTSGTISGTVKDLQGAHIPNATITITNQTTHEVRTVTTNGEGYFVIAALIPDLYTVRVTANNFAGKEVTGISVHAGDQIPLPDTTLAAGAVTDQITVQSAEQILNVANGERSELLDYRDIQDLDLQGRDTSELLKVLPGVATVSNGPTNNTSGFNPTNITAGQSAIGSGLNVSGAPNRGGTALLLDGVNILDVGNNASGLATINPEMTQEITVLTNNFGADTEFGPVVVSAISKSGGDAYHGMAYLNARNDALNANDWQSKHQGKPKGGAHYYYPGGNIGGPVPFTHKKVFFFGGAEALLQNQGNASTLTSFIPTPAMLAGNFSLSDPANAKLCPQGFGSASGAYWCTSLAGANFIDRTGAVVQATPYAGGGVNGYTLPAGAINQNVIALTKLWPTANADPTTTPGGYNYYQPVINVNNGYIYRLRFDYAPSENDRAYISYQQGYSKQLAQGNGAHVYFTPAYAIPFPGGGLSATTYSKVVAGHYVHTFNATTTNELIASWTYGYIPYGASNIEADYKNAVGYSQGYVYGTGSPLVPSYGAGGTKSFPDYSQRDFFENGGVYPAKKQIPQFADNLTKVIGNHTFKFGGFTENVDNYQGNMATNLNGALTFAGGPNPNFAGVGGTANIGSNNPTANFVTGTLSSYSESQSSPVQDLAYQVVSFYANDSWKVSPRLSFQLGVRFDHIGHWYDRGRTGIAVFFPARVRADFNAGKVNPGFYWHAIDPGVPIGGMPDKFAYVSPRLGLSYDLFGTGKTLLRGGFGSYRFPNQYNDSANALITAQAVQQYSTGSFYSSKTFQLSQVGSLKAPAPGTPQAITTSAQTGFDPTDNGTPVTYDWNFTIDQHLPGRFLLDVAYVGNSSQQLLNSSQTIAGSSYANLANLNKAPIGAFFAPDPVTGVVSPNPENLSQGAPNNKSADYRPYGFAYGTNNVTMLQSQNYANYNALQAAVVKRAGHLTLNVNFTWSKALGTVLNRDPFNNRNNYGPQATDRPYIFNSSYIYRFGDVLHKNFLVNGAVNGWTISGVSIWQAGTYTLPSIGLAYQSGATPAGVTSTSVGSATYFGTDAGLNIVPALTCDPTKNLQKFQVFNASCFTLPAPPAPGQIAQNGGRAYPYIRGAAFLENDLALYKTFTLHENHKVQVRASLFNWLNHPLPQFSAASQYTINYLVNAQSRAVSVNPSTSSTVGFLDAKNGAPGQRNVELDVRYSF